MTTTHTAWVTTDRSALENDLIDVVILANDEDGNSVGDPLFSAKTSVSHDADDTSPAFDEAKDILANAGWRTVGDWREVPSGAVISVERS